MSDTPRTDIEEVRFNLSGAYGVNSHFARQLERELNEMASQCDEWRKRAESAEGDTAALQELLNILSERLNKLK